jgi:hypothetical protein
MPESNQHTCAYCQRVFADKDGRYDKLLPNQLVLRQCDECLRLDEAGNLNSLGKKQFESPFTAAAALIMYFSFTMTIGDYRGSLDHWHVNDHAKIAYAAMLFPAAILWSCAQKQGAQLLLLLGLSMAVYPFIANNLLGDGALLLEQTRKGISPASGALFVWLASGSLLVGVWHIFGNEDGYEPNRIKYDRTAAGFIKSYIISAALIYLAGLAIGYWKQGDYGLSLQVTAGMWRAPSLAVPVAYFFWTVPKMGNLPSSEPRIRGGA